MKHVALALICVSLAACTASGEQQAATVGYVDDGLPPGDRITADPLPDAVAWDPTRENGRPDGPVLTTVPVTTAPWKERDVVLAPLGMLFASGSTRPQLISSMENGEELIGAFEKAAASPNVPPGLQLRVVDAKPASEVVCNDAGISNPCAYAKYILVTGDRYASNFINAYFVRQNGRWKVSMRSICELIASQQVPCPVELPPSPGEIRMKAEADAKLSDATAVETTVR